MEFKIGDKVRVKPEIKTPAYEWGEVTPGEQGIITDFFGDRMYVDFPSQSEWEGLTSEMELVEPPFEEIINKMFDELDDKIAQKERRDNALQV